jgi:hypothetical protein
MSSDRDARGEAHVLPKHRRRAVVVTLCVLALLPLACVTSRWATGLCRAHDSLEEATLNESEQSVPDELANLLPPLDGFEVVGVSQDKRIVGLACAGTVGEVMMNVDQGMQARGWKVLPSEGEHLRCYGRQPDVHAASSIERVSYALVVVQQLGDGVSTLVQFA